MFPDKEYYITHFVPDELPEENYKKLKIYLSRDGEFQEEWFHFEDDLYKTIDGKTMESLIGKGEAVKLHYPVNKEKYGSIFSDTLGNIYYCNLEKIAEEDFMPQKEDLELLMNFDSYVVGNK